MPIAFLKFNRGAEAEADYLGIQYMYKAGYDPNSYVAFFGKVMEEERRVPGSMPNVFMDHPPTGDRIIKSEEEIKQILPKREQYLVSTSEFDDVKARLQQVISNRKKLKPGDSGDPLCASARQLTRQPLKPNSHRRVRILVGATTNLPYSSAGTKAFYSQLQGRPRPGRPFVSRRHDRRLTGPRALDSGMFKRKCLGNQK